MELINHKHRPPTLTNLTTVAGETSGHPAIIFDLSHTTDILHTLSHPQNLIEEQWVAMEKS